MQWLFKQFNRNRVEALAIDVEFQLSHIDRMPLGDLARHVFKPVDCLPHIHWIFFYRVNQLDFEFDDAPIKKELEGISFTEPDVLSFIRQMIETGIAEIQPVIS